LSTRLRSIATACLLAALTGLLYGPYLREAPLSPGEMAIATQAEAQAAGGTDAAGHTLPLLVAAADDRWLQPAAVYATALAGRVAPADIAGRVAGVVVAGLNVALVYAFARRRFRGEGIAVAAAALLMTTPSHFALARGGGDALYIFPCLLVWLIALTEFLDSGRTWQLLAAMTALGAATYTQPAAPITVALLAALTLATLWAAGRRAPSAYAAAGTGLFITLIPLALWFAMYPDTYRDTFGRWAVHAAHLRSPADAFHAFVNWTTLGERLSHYWTFFNPAWLFLAERPMDPTITVRGAPLAVVVAMLAPLGAVRLIRVGPPWQARLMLAGAALAPAAAATFGEPFAIRNAMALVLFAVLLAGYGLVQVRGWSAAFGNAFVVAAVAASALQWLLL
jgi:hypothetical protein